MTHAAEILHSAGSAVWTASWQGSILILFVAAVSLGLRRWIPARSLAVLWLVVLTRLVLPVTPETSFSLFNLGSVEWLRSSEIEVNEAPITDIARTEAVSPAGEAMPFARSPFSDTASAMESVASSAAILGDDVQHAASSDPGNAVIADAESNRFFDLNLSKTLSVVWLVVASCLMLRAAFAAVVLTRRINRLKPAEDSQLEELVAVCCHEVGTHRHVRVVLDDSTSSSPAVTGLLRPTLILPTCLLESLTRDELRFVLLHEFAHLRRGDLMINWLHVFVRALHWFNPLIWMATRRMDYEREAACDEFVLLRTRADSGIEYGRTMLTVLECLSVSRVPSPAVGFASSRNTLKRRIEAVIRFQHADARRVTLSFVMLAILAVCGLTDAKSEADPIPVDEPTDAQQDKSESPHESPEKQREPGLDENTAGDSLRISGRCVDSKNQPISGIDVGLFEIETLKQSRRVLRSRRTGKSGLFEFRSLPEFPADGSNDRYFIIVARKAGWSTMVRQFYSGTEVKPLNFTMQPAAKLRGVVTDADGKPVEGAVVYRSRIGPSAIDGVLSAVSDKNGRFELNDVPEWIPQKREEKVKGRVVVFGGGTAFLHARHPEAGMGLGTYQQVPSTVEIQLKPAAIATGRVVHEETGKPVSGVYVAAQAFERNGWGEALTDEEGNFRLPLSQADSYNIWAIVPGLTMQAIPGVKVEHGKTTAAGTIKLTKGAIVKGRLLHSVTGEPVLFAGAGRPRIGLYGPSRPRTTAAIESAPVADDGTFQIRVAPGENYLYFTGAEGIDRNKTKPKSFTLDIDEGETKSIEFTVLPDSVNKDGDVDLINLEKENARKLTDLERQQTAEKAAIAAIKSLGGFVTKEKFGAFEFVTEINMAYGHVDEKRVNNDQFTDEALSYVPKFKHLKALYIKGGQATNDGMKEVRKLTSLETLLMWDAEVSDLGIKYLMTMPKLNRLHVSNAGLTDRSLATFSRMKSLTSLSLQGNRFTDEGLSHLSRMPQLKRALIGLGESRFTNEGMVHLKGLKNLTRLGLQSSPISDAGLAHLSELSNLSELWLNGNHVTDEGVKAFHEKVPNCRIQR